MNTRSRSRASQSSTDSSRSSAGRIISIGANTSSRSPRRRSLGTGNSDLARNRYMKTHQLMKTERKLVRSCEHVILLNDKIRGLTKRYQKARADGFKSFRYNLRIRLAAVEGVRNMYYEYARDRAEEVAELRKELYDQNVQIITGSEADESEDEFEPVAEDDQSEQESEPEEDMDADDEEED